MPFGLTGLGQGGADADLNSEIRSNGGCLRRYMREPGESESTNLLFSYQYTHFLLRDFFSDIGYYCDYWLCWAFGMLSPSRALKNKIKNQAKKFTSFAMKLLINSQKT